MADIVVAGEVDAVAAQGAQACCHLDQVAPVGLPVGIGDPVAQVHQDVRLGDAGEVDDVAEKLDRTVAPLGLRNRAAMDVRDEA
jgi:hypothetical protein